MTSVRFFSFLILKVSMPALVLAQSDTAKHQVTKHESYLKSYPGNMVAMAKRPAEWKRDDWFQFGGSVVLIGAFIPMDEVLNIPFENWQNDVGNRFGEVGDVMGGLPFQFGLSGAALGIGAITKNKKWQDFALDNLQAQLFTGGITWITKELFHRARPDTKEGAFAWYGPFNGGSNESFFSGHTSLSFSTATMIFLHTGKKWWVGLISYSLASAVGISRMQQQKHWASDVVAGAMVGTVTSHFIYDQQQKRRAKNQKLKPLP